MMNPFRYLKGLFKPVEVILNIGLDGPSYQDNVMQPWERWTAIVLHYQDILVNASARKLGDTVVIKGQLRRGVGELHISALAELANQDCIAVWYVHDQVGKLVGPNAKAWGSFDRKFFKFGG